MNCRVVASDQWPPMKPLIPKHGRALFAGSENAALDRTRAERNRRRPPTLQGSHSGTVVRHCLCALAAVGATLPVPAYALARSGHDG